MKILKDQKEPNLKTIETHGNCPYIKRSDENQHQKFVFYRYMKEFFYLLFFVVSLFALSYIPSACIYDQMLPPCKVSKRYDYECLRFG